MKPEQEIYDLLKKYNLSVTTAESCTGGMIASELINVPGISEYLKEAYITYSNEAKTKLLGVDSALIERFTVVSPEVAAAMAEGAAKTAGTDLAVSSTGIAGPDGGTETQPVGLVYIGCAFHGQSVTRKFVFSGERNEVRSQAAAEALFLLKETILNYAPENE